MDAHVPKKERRKYPDFSSIEINQPSNHLESIKTDSQGKKQPTPGKESTIFKYHQGTQVKKNTGKEPLLSVFLICCLDHQAPRYQLRSKDIRNKIRYTGVFLTP